MKPDLPDLSDESSGERVSVTDVHGTIARFEMSYSPVGGERVVFGPPLRLRLPSFFFLAFGMTLVAVSLAAPYTPSQSYLHRWFVEGDAHRPVPALILACVILVSAVGTVVRAHMRGVVVHGDGIEARYILTFGVPRVKRWTWPQIHRLVMDHDAVMLELWDGTYERLPDVAAQTRLASMLASIAFKRNMPVTELD